MIVNIILYNLKPYNLVLQILIKQDTVKYCIAIHVSPTGSSTSITQTNNTCTVTYRLFGTTTRFSSNKTLCTVKRYL